MIGQLTIHLHLPGCRSLKEKRGLLKPLLARMQRKFNLTVSEMGLQDHWDEALIACAMLGNETVYLQRSLATVLAWVEANWPDGQVFDHTTEMIL
jgi:uncharacterized protein YlxP (DUF503 family)